MNFIIPEYPPNWDEIRIEVLELDKHRCQSCGKKSRRLHIHHMKPLSKRGTNDAYNLVTLCEECYRAKHPLLDPSITTRTGPMGVKYFSYLHCEKCNKKHSHDTGLYYCPECEVFLKTKTVVKPPRGKYDYHHLKHSEDIGKDTQLKDEVSWLEPTK